MKKTYLKALAFGTMCTLLVSCMDEPTLTPTEKTTQRNARQSANPSSVTLSKDKFIVIATANELSASIDAEITAAGGRVDNKMAAVGILTATSTDPNFRSKAEKIAGIRSVIPDFTAQWTQPIENAEVVEEAFGNPPNSGDNDTRFDLQWGHDAINAPEAWNAGYRGEGATVAVLDGGFDLDHIDLAPNIIGAVSFVPGEGASYALPDPFSHGTHVAGTVAAADNGIGIIGVAPLSKLLLVKVLSDGGSGAFSWMLQGILYATAQGADVINMSLGAYLPRNGKFLNEDGSVSNETKAVQELIVAITRVTNFAVQNGVTIIAAAGNDAINGDKDGSGIHIPSGVPSVISISATAPIGWAVNPATNLDIFTSYSNYGIADVAFAAPGGDALVSVTGSCTVAGITRNCRTFDLVFSAGSNLNLALASYYWSAGTSMASPHAAGVAALIVGKNGGSMDPSAVEAKLRASADDLGKPGQDAFYGSGRVNALKAVQ
jgi:lantibiotic leader peptide-processing serine protease